MDDNVFDGLARRVATRRGALAAVSGMLAAIIPAARGAGAQPARCVAAGGRCSAQQRCCSGSNCASGTCRCTSGLTNCGGQCVNVGKDRNHCGKCNSRCGSNLSCTNGVCCATGRVICGGRCCAAGEGCVPARAGVPATCCSEQKTFVLCPAANIATNAQTGLAFCNVETSQGRSLEKTCCPGEAICGGDGICCIDPATGRSVACDAKGMCPFRGPAVWTPPKRGG